MFSEFLSKAIYDVGMVSRPSYYSGRGATTSDLDSDKLRRIYSAIVKKEGNDAGKAFVKMVAEMPVMSATDFLLNLSALEQNKFCWGKNMLSQKKGISIEDEGSALGTVVSLLTKSRDEDTRANNDMVRGEFLSDHGYAYNPYPTFSRFQEGRRRR